jgi:hypothetical protein
MLFFEYFEKDTVFTSRQMILSVLAGLTAMAYIVGDFQATWLELEGTFLLAIDTVSNIISIAMELIVSTLVLLKIGTIYSEAWDIQKKQLKLMIIGVEAAYWVPIVFIPFEPLLSPVIGHVLLKTSVTIGFTLYYFSFGATRHFGFLQRNKADHVLVIDTFGFLLLSHRFKLTAEPVDEEDLAAGLLVFSGLLHEVTKTLDDVSEVQLADKRVLIFEPRLKFLAVVITPEGSRYLKKSLNRFATALEEEISDVTSEMETREAVAKCGHRLLFDSFGLP